MAEVLGRILHTVEPLSEQLQALEHLLEDIKAKLNRGLKEETLVAVTRLLPDNAGQDADFLVNALIQRYDAAEQVVRQGESQTNLGPFLNSVQKRIAGLMQLGDIVGAARAADEGLLDFDHQRADFIENFNQAELRLIETAIAAHLAAGQAFAIAEKELRRIDLVAPREARFGALRSKQDEYYVRGRDKGAGLDLEVAIALARLSVDRAATLDERGSALNNLGNALRNLGGRTEGPAGLQFLNEAAQAYRDALEVRTRKDLPLQWAMTQNNLGTALGDLGGRTEERPAFNSSTRPPKPIAMRLRSIPARTCRSIGR